MKNHDLDETTPNDFREALALLEQKLRDCEDSESLIDGLLEGTAQFYGADRAYMETSLGSCLMQTDTNDEYEQSRIELKNKISSRRQEIVRLRGLVRSLYENLVNGNITKDEYYDYKAKYEGKINMIAPEIETLEQALQLIEKQEEQQRRLAKDAESIRQDHELTAALIDRLIERVDVSSDKQISVTYRFKSEYENCKEVLRQCRNM